MAKSSEELRNKLGQTAIQKHPPEDYETEDPLPESYPVGETEQAAEPEVKAPEQLASAAQVPAAVKSAAPAGKKAKSLEQIFIDRKNDFAEVLAATGLSVDRFLRVLITEIGSTPALYECMLKNPTSILSCCLEIATLGLDPSIPNEVHLVPFNQKEGNGYKPVCTVITGYKGLAKLAIEAAREAGIPLVTLRQDVVHQNDIYERTMGDSPTVLHRPPPFGKDRGPVIGFVATSKDAFGRINFVEMNVDEVKTHMKRFTKSKNGPWADPDNFNAYGLKTVLRQLVNKYLPMGAKVSRAIALDPEMRDRKALMYPTSDKPIEIGNTDYSQADPVVEGEE